MTQTARLTPPRLLLFRLGYSTERAWSQAYSSIDAINITCRQTSTSWAFLSILCPFLLETLLCEDALIGRVPLKLRREANLDHIRTTGSIEEPP